MKTLFFGTPETAVPFLELLSRKSKIQLVVSQPDRPAGRALAVNPTPVKAAALRLGLKVLQPNKPVEVLGEVQATGADLAVVVAYGRILPESVLAATKHGFLNVHFSLLPKYRGAAPIQWSLWKGETVSGVSLFWLDKGMDTGPMFMKKDVVVAPEDDALTLEKKLVGAGLQALEACLDAIGKGDLRRTPQAGEATLAPMLEKTHGNLDFAKPAAELHNQVRALCRWPVAYRETSRNGKPLKFAVLKTLPPAVETGPWSQPPGTVVSIERGRGILVQCSLGRIWIKTVQPEGRKPMEAFDFANGLRLKVGDTL